MNSPTSRWLHFLLAVIVILELTGRLTRHIQLEYFVKPLVMRGLVLEK